MKNTSASACVKMHFSILKEKGISLSLQDKILDFGCGDGQVVLHYKKLGFINSFGCDIEIPHHVVKLIENGILKKIDLNNYKIPFEDQYFDFIFSNQVFEHVQDYESACSEIERVLKYGGCCLHIFPSKWTLIERHTKVPFAAFIQWRLWLDIWAILGIRNKFQKGCTWSETSHRNFKYLHAKTNYLNKKQIRDIFGQYFDSVEFCELLFLKYHGGRAASLYQLAKFIGFIPSLYSALRMRCIFLRK